MSDKTLQHLYKGYCRQLRDAGIATAELDTSLLVEFASGKTRLDRLANADLVLDDLSVKRLENAFARRLAGEPVHRIIGRRGFYGRDFKLSAETLVPRPDTETLIDLVLPVLRALSEQQATVDVLDMGTGSGIIAVTLAAEIANVRVVAVDLSEDALRTTVQNAVDCGVADRVTPLQSDWFDRVEGKFDLIISNPPYIPRGDIEKLDDAVRRFDPLRALDGGRDGLDFYRALARDNGQHLKAGGMMAVEIGMGQESDVAALFAAHGLWLKDHARDLGGILRAMLFKKS